MEKQKYTVEQVIQTLAKEGYSLKDPSQYVNTREKLDLVCPNKHVWHADIHKFLSGYRCFHCRGSTKSTQESIKSEIEAVGYKLLSGYLSAKKHITVQCPNGHTYDTLINTFRRSKCKKCMYENRKITTLEIE